MYFVVRESDKRLAHVSMKALLCTSVAWYSLHTQYRKELEHWSSVMNLLCIQQTSLLLETG